MIANDWIATRMPMLTKSVEKAYYETNLLEMQYELLQDELSDEEFSRKVYTACNDLLKKWGQTKVIVPSRTYTLEEERVIQN